MMLSNTVDAFAFPIAKVHRANPLFWQFNILVQQVLTFVLLLEAVL